MIQYMASYKPPIERPEIESWLFSHGLSLTWLAAQLNANRQALVNWLQGTNVPRDPEMWQKLRKIMQDQDTKSNSLQAPRRVAEPMSTYSAKGIPCYRFAPSLSERNAPKYELHGLLSSYPPLVGSDQCMALMVSGSTWEPRMMAGDTLLIRPDPTETFDTLVAATDTNGGLTVAVIHRGDPGATPCGSDRPDPLLKIVGPVVAIYRDAEAGPNIEYRDGKPLKA